MPTPALRTLLDQATQDRDEAVAALQAAEARVAAAERQQRQLAEYRAHYRDRWTSQFGQRGGGGMEIVQCYQNFAERLEQAIGQQTHSVGHAQAQVQRLRLQLQQRELRLASVRKLAERRLAALNQAESRREQKASDEAALRSRPASLPGVLG
jgi:flagellar protein FliJ